MPAPWYVYRVDITSVTIGNSVTSVGDEAFNGCYNMTSVTIGNSVTSIGYRAFNYCTGLTSITIPNSVTSIGDQAFTGCTGLTSITCEAVTPPTCGSICFDEIEESIPLYVPANSVEEYKEADGWKDFTNIQAIQAEALEDITDDQSPITNKLLRDGQIFIQKDNKTFTLDGKEIRSY